MAPLTGFTVGVTACRRRDTQAGLLDDLGAAVILGPVLQVVPAPPDRIRRATEELVRRPPDVLVATTGEGVERWLAAADSWGLGPALAAALARCRAAARGPKTAGALLAAGLGRPEITGDRLAGVVAEVAAGAGPGIRVAVQLAGAGGADALAALRRTGAEVVEVPVYGWEVPGDAAPAHRLVEAACTGRLDAVTFTTAPAVRNLLAIASAAGCGEGLRAALAGPVAAACIGPGCGAAARAAGMDACWPDRPRLGDLVATVAERLRARARELALAGGRRLVLQGAVAAVEGEVAWLSPRERAVLHALARRPGAVVGRETLAPAGGPAGAAGGHALEVTVARLRRKLGPAGAAVAAVARRGYRLDAEPA